jgi:PAS domain S-box-containing protein
MNAAPGPARSQNWTGPGPDRSPVFLPSVSVLIVDDNDSKRLALKAVLSPLGYSIVEADSGLAALRCVMKQDFAVILLDVRMPIMDGFETARRIRQRVQSEITPIIFITAFASDETDHADRFAQGAVDFMFAPVAPEELRAKVSVFANLFIKASFLAHQAVEAQASADRFSLLADAAPIGIFQTDADNRYVYTNPRWSEITGVSSEAALGRGWDTIIGSEQPANFRLEASADSLEGAELSRRFVIRPAGSASRIVLVTSRSILDSGGGMAGWVGTLADVTAEAGAEAAMADARDQAAEASRLKSDFLANMSHEIRTPMNGVIGMSDLLLETSLDTRQRDYAQTVRNSGEALLTIINDILDFSKIEAGKLEIEDIDFDLRTIVNGVVRLLSGSADAKGLALSAVIDPEVPAVISGDPGRVGQVLTNLVGNAIKFTHAGDIVVRVMPEAITGSTENIHFEVSDTGDGVAPDKLATVFQPFVQADTSTSRTYGGTGLGLAISSQLVSLMGGACGVSSQLKVGSIFWFTIRARARAEQVAQKLSPPERLTPTPPPSAATSLRSAGSAQGRLLLAEDNLINQKVAVAILSGAGYEVDVVPDGAAAVRAIQARAYDAILMDCQMPEMNGFEATAAIRAHEDGSGCRTPIIAVTAGARQEDREACLAEGMDAYLAKPIRKDALLALVAEWVLTSNRGRPVTPTEVLP